MGATQIYGATASNNAVPSALHANYHRTAAMRNLTAGEGITRETVGIPYGNRHPNTWVMPQKSGAISAHNSASVTIGATGAGAMGVAATGTAAIIFNATGTGGLIVSASGAAGFTISGNGDIFAALAVAGSAGITLDATGTTAAIGHLTATGGIVLDGSMQSYAVGWLSGSTEEAGLTPTGIATAVWAKIIEAGFSAEDIMRLLTAHAAGDADGLESTTPEFMSIDGATVRIAATLSAGTRTVTTRDAS